jgi:hypothetical protein
VFTRTSPALEEAGVGSLWDDLDADDRTELAQVFEERLRCSRRSP